jgi:hypothetical protein
MDPNRLVGFLLLATGVMDLVWARSLRDRLAPAARIALVVFGSIFLVVGGAVLMGWVKIA